MIDHVLLAIVALSSLATVWQSWQRGHRPGNVAPAPTPAAAAPTGLNAPHDRWQMLSDGIPTGHWVEPGTSDYNEILATPGLALRAADGRMKHERS